MRNMLALCSLVFPLSLNAAEYVFNGKIKSLTSHDSVLGANSDWLSIEGFTSAGQCALSNGLVVMRLRDDKKGERQLAMVLSASLAGRTVTGVVDDAVRDSGGSCFLKYIKFDS